MLAFIPFGKERETDQNQCKHLMEMCIVFKIKSPFEPSKGKTYHRNRTKDTQDYEQFLLSHVGVVKAHAQFTIRSPKKYSIVTMEYRRAFSFCCGRTSTVLGRTCGAVYRARRPFFAYMASMYTETFVKLQYKKRRARYAVSSVFNDAPYFLSV